MTKPLYHTIKKKGTTAASLRGAPYLCTCNPWLGVGYYFWDTFIDLAHWWGETHCHGRYIITQTDCRLGDGEVFDLVGNTEHIKVFADYVEMLEKKTGEEATVPQVIEHMKRHTKFLDRYKAIRADGRLSISSSSPYTFRVKFSQDKSQFIDLLPPIQYCIVNRSDALPLAVAFES